MLQKQPCLEFVQWLFFSYNIFLNVIESHEATDSQICVDQIVSLNCELHERWINQLFLQSMNRVRHQLLYKAPSRSVADLVSLFLSETSVSTNHILYQHTPL